MSAIRGKSASVAIEGVPRILELIQALVLAEAQPMLLTVRVYFVLFFFILGILKLANWKIFKFIKKQPIRTKQYYRYIT